MAPFYLSLRTNVMVYARRAISTAILTFSYSIPRRGRRLPISGHNQAIVIVGPPGTGKTGLVSRIILHCAHLEREKLLLSANIVFRLGNFPTAIPWIASNVYLLRYGGTCQAVRYERASLQTRR